MGREKSETFFDNRLSLRDWHVSKRFIYTLSDLKIIDKIRLSFPEKQYPSITQWVKSLYLCDWLKPSAFATFPFLRLPFDLKKSSAIISPPLTVSLTCL